MSNYKLIFIVSWLACLITSTTYSSMSSTNFTIKSSAFAASDEAISSTNFNLTATMGQSIPVDNVSSANFNLNSGFWHNLLSIAIGDVNDDGTVDLQDVILALQVVTGMSPTEIHIGADANQDGQISIVEAIDALRQAAGL